MHLTIAQNLQYIARQQASQVVGVATGTMIIALYIGIAKRNQQQVATIGTTLTVLLLSGKQRKIID